MPIALPPDEAFGVPADSLTFKHLNTQARQYPTRVEPTSYGGYKLVSTKDVAELTVMEKFEGPIVHYTQPNLTDYDRRYVLNIYDPSKYTKPAVAHPLDCDGWVWMLPLSNARYSNHSCVPNCIITSNLEVVTLLSVKAGEELTFLYNHTTEEGKWFWDPLWSFDCACGSQYCQGTVDRYRKVGILDHQQVSDNVRSYMERFCKE